MSGTKRRFLLCLNNRAYPASLELCKVYQAVPDANAAKQHFVRVIDESGDDYLYPQSCFVPIELPAEAALDKIAEAS